MLGYFTKQKRKVFCNGIFGKILVVYFFAFFWHSFALAGYSCNDFWCRDTKAGLGGYVDAIGINGTNPNLTQGGAYFAVHFRRWQDWFSFGGSADFGLGSASIKSTNATNSANTIPNLAKSSLHFGVSGTLYAGLNAYQLDTPIFVDIFVNFRSHIYEVDSKMPSKILLSLGTSLSSLQNLNDTIGIEYGISYGYIVYGEYIFRNYSSYRPNPQFPTNEHKTNDTSSRINPNSHEVKAFIGLFDARGAKASLYGRISAIYHHLDSSRVVAFDNAPNVSYPRSQNISITLEMGVGF